MNDHNRVLLTLGEAFAKATGRRLTTVGKLVRNETRFFSRLAQGGSCSTKNYEAVLAYFSAHWPPGMDWPDGITRPAQRQEIPKE